MCLLWGWLRESNEKVLDEVIFLKDSTTTSSKTVVCLCGRRWWNGALGEVTVALFTLAGPFKDTRRRQCRQLYLGLHGDGVLLTGNFPDSLPDEEVAFYLTASLFASIPLMDPQKYKKEREMERKSGSEENNKWNCKSQKDQRKRLQVRNENIEGGKQGGKKVNRHEDEEEEWLRAMLLKCRPSTEFQSGRCRANGLFGEKREDSRSMERGSELRV